MEHNCPHCRTLVDVVESVSDTVVCPSCGSTFENEALQTADWAPSKGGSDTAVSYGTGDFSLGSVATVDEIPDQLGRFEIQAKLGMGAFGVVYRAYDPKLARQVAIKVPRGGHMLSSEELHRFLREARSVSSLQHANIVPVFEVGDIDSVPYIVSELVVGKPLSGLLSKGLPRAKQAAKWISAVAEALEHAHNNGIIHRDVKPSNILVEKETKTAKLMDFGLARRDTGEATVTLDGQVLGTPAYMSPEQAAGHSHEVDRRSDVYSLGVTLYVLLTGELPFRGNHRMLMHQVLNEEPRSPRSLNDRIPSDLETITLKAMAKQPLRRYASAAEMHADLQRWLNGEPIEARPVTRIERAWRTCKRNPVVSGLVALLALVMIAVTIGSTIFSFHFGRLAQSERRARKDADQKKVEAIQLAKESRDRLVRLYVSNGLKHAEEDDPALALPWVVEALKLAQPGTKDEQLHRMRLGSLLLQHPRPVKFWFGHEAVLFIDIDRSNQRMVLASLSGHAQVFDLPTGAAVTEKLQHQGAVQYVQFSPDGKWVATASRDKTARIWNAATGKPATPPLQHKGAVGFLQFHPSKPELLTCSADKTIRRWSITTGAQIGKSLEHPRPLFMCAYSPQGDRVVGACEDKLAYVWKIDGDEKPVTIEHDHIVRFAAFSPDGFLVVTASHSGLVRIADAATGKLRTPLLKHEKPAIFLRFSQDGSKLVTCSEDHSARIWQVKDGQPLTPPLKHEAAVAHASFSPNEDRLATAASDGTVRIWDVKTGRPVSPPLRHSAALNCVQFTGADGLVTGGWGRNVRQWHLPDTDQGIQHIEHKFWVNKIVISRKGKFAATASSDRSASLWDVAAKKLVCPRLESNKLQFNDVNFSPDEQTLVTACSAGGDKKRGAIIFWNTSSGAERLRVDSESPVNRAIYDSTGTKVLAIHKTHASIIDAASGKPLVEQLNHDKEILQGEFDRAGKRVVTTSFDKLARVWDATTGKKLHEFVHNARVDRARFTPDGRYLVSACSGLSDASSARVWDLTTGKIHATVPLRVAYVLDVAVSPDGKSIATAGSDGIARVWDLHTGRAITSPLVHRSVVQQVRFNSGGEFLITTSWDKTARVWDAATGLPVTASLRHGDWVMSADFDPNGEFIATACRDKFGRLWPLQATSISLTKLELIAHLLSGHRVDTTGGLVRLNQQELRSAWERMKKRLKDEG